MITKYGWQNYTYPANKKLVERSKDMRKNMTQAERKIWFEVLSKDKNKWIKQRIIGSYIVDFFCFELGVVIEIDGDSHNNRIDYDKVRTEFLESMDIKVVRFSNKEILNNLENISLELSRINQPVIMNLTPPNLMF